jgi:hypothetical protein
MLPTDLFTREISSIWLKTLPAELALAYIAASGNPHVPRERYIDFQNKFIAREEAIE